MGTTTNPPPPCEPRRGRGEAPDVSNPDICLERMIESLRYGGGLFALCKGKPSVRFLGVIFKDLAGEQ